MGPPFWLLVMIPKALCYWGRWALGWSLNNKDHLILSLHPFDLLSIDSNHNWDERVSDWFIQHMDTCSGGLGHGNEETVYVMSLEGWHVHCQVSSIQPLDGKMVLMAGTLPQAGRADRVLQPSNTGTDRTPSKNISSPPSRFGFVTLQWGRWRKGHNMSAKNGGGGQVLAWDSRRNTW